jgi:hypothetical protein
MPFTHPFGNDFEFFISPDAPYENLLAANNKGQGPGVDQEYKLAIQKATDPRGLNLKSAGVLGIEIDGGLVPEMFRVADGDRVAVFGRLISDCGHTDFHTEIHPPLAIAAARTLPDRSVHSTLVGRPYLVSQEFGDGDLRAHLIRELKKCVGDPEVCDIPGVPCSLQVEAHPKVFVVPFSGIVNFDYLVRASEPRITLADRLMVTYHFTVRTGVSVRLEPLGPGDFGVRVHVTMDASDYIPARLPAKNEPTISFADLARMGPNWLQVVTDIFDAFPNPILDAGIKTDRYANPDANSIVDRHQPDVDVDQLANNQHYWPDDGEPFPIYGWLDLQWIRGAAAWGAGWEDKGGAVTGPLSVVSWGPGRLDIFGVTAAGTVQHLWFDTELGGWGAGWEDKGGAVTGPLSVVSWGPGRLDIFGVTATHTVQHLWFDYAQGAVWPPGWEDKGGAVTGPLSVVSWGPQRLDILGVINRDALQHLWFG